jgi:hypothetical protein
MCRRELSGKTGFRTFSRGLIGTLRVTQGDSAYLSGLKKNIKTLKNFYRKSESQLRKSKKERRIDV